MYNVVNCMYLLNIILLNLNLKFIAVKNEKYNKIKKIINKLKFKNSYIWIFKKIKIFTNFFFKKKQNMFKNFENFKFIVMKFLNFLNLNFLFIINNCLNSYLLILQLC